MIVDRTYYDQIYIGDKTVEGRKNSKTWNKIKKNDVIKIICGEDFFYVLVTNVIPYGGEDPLLSYLQKEGLNKTLPGIESFEEGKRIYLQWSTEKEIRENGFLGIHIKTFFDIL